MAERYTLTSAGRFNIAPGLAPWRGHGGKRSPMTFTADADALDTVPLLRRARAKRRCLVLADGWFAWRKLARKSQPYWIHTPAPLAFAGIAALHPDDSIDSFAVITVPAAGIAAQLGPTMPALVDDRWLASPELVALPLTDWRADPVSSRVDDPALDDASVVAVLGNPAQGELF